MLLDALTKSTLATAVPLSLGVHFAVWTCFEDHSDRTVNLAQDLPAQKAEVSSQKATVHAWLRFRADAT